MTLTTTWHKRAQLVPGTWDMMLSGQELLFLSPLLASGRWTELEHLHDFCGELSESGLLAGNDELRTMEEGP